jgi:hypothetical protein
MTSGLKGMVNASLEVARRLEASGHGVVYASPENVRGLVERHGIEYRQLAPVQRQPAPERLRRSGESRLTHKLAEWNTRGARRRDGVAALGMEPFRALLGELAPDLALVDFDLEEHAITCVTSSITTVMLSPWFEFRKLPGLPPLSSTLRRGSPLQRWLAWTGQRLRSRRKLVRTYLRYFGTDRRGVIEEYASRAGFPADGLWPHDWETLFAFDPIPVWSMTAAELDFPHARRESFSYIGPMVRLGRLEDGPSGNACEQLERIVAEAREAGRRVLYASLTSMGAPNQDASNFAKRLIQAVSLREDWTLVLGLGGSESALDALAAMHGGPLPPQIQPMTWAPQLAALRHADLFISHGGIHSIHEAIATGTPIVIYSGSAFDQDGCAARLAFHGAADVGSRGESSEKIASRLEAALKSPELEAQVKALQPLTQDDRGALDAALAAVLPPKRGSVRAGAPSV